MQVERGGSELVFIANTRISLKPCEFILAFTHESKSVGRVSFAVTRASLEEESPLVVETTAL